ncbi:MAG: flavodoxin family protein [Candidatus Omnitrophica bacterium]|nr:flavodoxin family protein [Candidatus Omnitrophota bacterium]
MQNSKKQLVLICASARTKGNTEIIVDSIIHNISMPVYNVNKINIAQLNIKPCTGCGKCSNGSKCVIEDDLDQINKSLEKADVIAIASPLYFCSIPAQLKALVDRSQPQWVQKYVLCKSPIANREAQIAKRKIQKGIFILCAASDNQKYFECSKSIIKSFFNVRDIDYYKDMFIPEVDEKGDVLKHKELLVKAIEIVSEAINSD